MLKPVQGETGDPMRPLGWFLIVLGLVVGAGLWLVPTEVSVLGTTGSCGAPILRVVDDNQNGVPEEDAFNLRQTCHDRSVTRLTLGVVLGGILGLSGIVFALAGGGTPLVIAVPAAAPSVSSATAIAAPTAPAGWYSDPWGHAALRWWDGTQWGPQIHNGSSAGPAS